MLSRNGNVDVMSIPDHVEVPHEETDDDFTNLLMDSESESDFGDNGYCDPTSSSEGEESDEQFHPQGSDLVSPPVTDDGRCGASTIRTRLRTDCPQPKPESARRRQAGALIDSAIAISDAIETRLSHVTGPCMSQNFRAGTFVDDNFMKTLDRADPKFKKDVTSRSNAMGARIYTEEDAPMDLRYQYDEWELGIDGRIDRALDT